MKKLLLITFAMFLFGIGCNSDKSKQLTANEAFELKERCTQLGQARDKVLKKEAEDDSSGITDYSGGRYTYNESLNTCLISYTTFSYAKAMTDSGFWYKSNIIEDVLTGDILVGYEESNSGINILCSYCVASLDFFKERHKQLMEGDW